MKNWIKTHKDIIAIIGTLSVSLLGAFFTGWYWLDNKFDSVKTEINRVTQENNNRFDSVYRIIVEQQGGVKSNEARIDEFIKQHTKHHELWMDTASAGRPEQNP